MTRRALRIIIAFLATALQATICLHARELSFAERVAAQEAIEHVYYSHQIGVSKPFQDAVPREVIENKVRTYLKQTAAVEQYWHTLVTSEMLRQEMTRITQNTRFPDRLKEIYRVLGNDPFLMEECLARPALVDRLARSFFSSDERIHGATRAEAENLRSRLADGSVSPLADAPNRMVLPAERDGAVMGSPRVPAPGVGRRSMTDAPSGTEAAQFVLDGTSASRNDERGREAPTVTDAPEAFIVKAPLSDEREGRWLAVYSFPKISWDLWWSRHRADFDDSSIAPVAGDSTSAMILASLGSDRLDCIAGDTWSNGNINSGVPDARSHHVAVWTGTVMVIWGGSISSELPNPTTHTGGRYDPLTDRWTLISLEGAPQASADATAVWTGNEMIVWGGQGGPQGQTLLGTGGRYDPVRDVWAPVSTLGSPSPRYGHTAVWTGDRMIVWGGFVDASQTTLTGGRYDPATDTWSPTHTGITGSAASRALHQAVWTGSVMVVWGGVSQVGFFPVWPIDGGRYDPVADRWQPITGLGAPAGRERFSAVWTGSEMLVQGGNGACTSSGFCAKPILGSGGRYDPVLDRWRPMATFNAPQNLPGQAAFWTGRELVTWGWGVPAQTIGRALLRNYGARYDPLADQWTPISTVNAPPEREQNTGVWTGTLMIVWGGRSVPDGGRYDPASDTWTPTSMPTVRVPQLRSSAVWTGNEMVFWGGNSAVSGFYVTNLGGRYDPLLDQWSPTSTVNVPREREHQLAVWTGDEMIVWGGNLYLNINYPLDTGGRYNPRSDSWSATSTTGAPISGLDSSAVWTGSRMIVWGGALYGGSVVNSGAQYDPLADRWTPVSNLGAPSARSRHTAVWTGKDMVVWGGTSGSEINTGGRYDPVLDRWSPTTLLNAPTGRKAHSSVWTGTEMLIWGGIAGSQGTASGALYNPALDSWRTISLTRAPSPRTGQTAIWTGKEMIIWGGQVNNQPLEAGGRYDPSLDQWMPMSAHDAPEGRWDHTAVWTGEMMIIWGGPYSRYVATGGRYFPYAAGQQFAVDAGTDVVAECGSPNGAVVALLAAGRSCSDSANLTYSWSGPFSEGGGLAQGPSPTVTLPLGTSTLTLRMEDGLGHSATDTMAVTVRDTTAPALACPSLAPGECSSPDGTPMSIPPAQVSDVCDPNPVVENSRGAGGVDVSDSYPLGITEVTMTATDSSGNHAACIFPVTVQDTTPPQITSAITPSILWPPNHRMITVSAPVISVDACSTPSVVLDSITSSEPDDKAGSSDGVTSEDIQEGDLGTPDFEFLLRAERSGEGNGRFYRVNYSAVDSSGNRSVASSLIAVPHDQGGTTEPVTLSTHSEKGGSVLKWEPVLGATSYRAIRGTVGSLRDAGDFIDLGQVSCITVEFSSPTDRLDPDVLPVGEARFYLVAYQDVRDSGYGTATATKPRVSTSGGCE